MALWRSDPPFGLIDYFWERYYDSDPEVEKLVESVLGAVLTLRGTEVDAVIVSGDADDAVLRHYFGRIIEVDHGDRFEAALDGLREVLLST